MILDERERDFENRFVHDRELRFRIRARRDGIVGLWAAGRLGLVGQEASDYAAMLVRIGAAGPGDDGVFRKVQADLEKAGSDAGEADIRTKMAEGLVQAEQELKTK